MTREANYGSMEEVAMRALAQDGHLPASTQVINEELGKVDPKGKEAHKIAKRYREGKGRRLLGPEILGIW